MPITKEAVIKALRNVEDPDLKKDLITLNMIKDIEVKGNTVNLTVVLTTPACPMKNYFRSACESAILNHVDKNAVVNVNITANTTSGRQKEDITLAGVKNIIAVASGKGGVGKSTVAANLAIALSKKGARVGLIDADIYGPSQHIMFGIEHSQMYVKERNGKSYMLPIEKYGVHLLSLGCMIDPDKAILWRGPMASNALRQLFTDVDWGELDYLLIDLPPGTGDIHLTLVSAVPVTGAVIVSTPQHVALADARKGVSMFQIKDINVPVLGLIENMAYFTPEELPGNRYYIFGKEGCRNLAAELKVPFLGEIPLVQSVREGGDTGIPIALDDNSVIANAFMEVADLVVRQVAIHNQNKGKVKSEEEESVKEI